MLVTLPSSDVDNFDRAGKYLYHGRWHGTRDRHSREYLYAPDD